MVVNFHLLSFAGCDLVAVLLFVGYEDVPRMFSPISRVRSEVAAPGMRDIPKVGIPSFNLVPAVPSSAHSRTPLSSGDLAGTPSPLTTLTFDLPETSIVDQSKAGDEGLHTAPSGPVSTILLLDFNSSRGSDLPEVGVGFEIQLDALPSSRVVCDLPIGNSAFFRAAQCAWGCYR